METGRSEPSLDILRKLSEIFEVSTDYLLKDEIESYHVEIKNKSLAEKVRLIDTLEADEQEALIKVIDGLLTKQKILDLLTQNRELAAKG